MTGTSNDPPIVAGVDAAGTSDEAIVWAADTAVRRGVGLMLVHGCVLPPGRRSLHAASAQMQAAAETLLQDKQDELSATHPDVPVRVQLVMATGAEALLTAARQASLVVVGSHRRGTLGSLLLGSISHTVVARSTAPVAVVRRRPDPHAPVVVGVELDDTCHAALSYAFEEAVNRKVAVHAIHAWAPDIVVGYGLWVLDQEVSSSLRDAARHELDAAVAEYATQHPGVQVHARLVQGSPAPVLVDAAAGAQLLMLGSHGRRALGRLLLGSVTSNVLHATESPVIVVPPVTRH